MERSEKESILKKGIGAAYDSLLDSENRSSSANKLREEVVRYSSEFVKMVPLFVPSVGKKITAANYLAVSVVHGLDQAKAADKLENQSKDFALGAVKGAALKGTFDALGAVNFSGVNKLAEKGLVPGALAGQPLELSAKAFSFGVSSRVIENGLTRENYLNADGTFDFSKGVSKNISEAFHPTALATDIAVFTGSTIALKGINVATRGLLDRSPMSQTIATGGSFGFFSGSVGEIQRQRLEDKHYDIGKVILRGFLEAGVSSMAAVPGGLRVRQLTNETNRTDYLPKISSRELNGVERFPVIDGSRCELTFASSVRVDSTVRTEQSSAPIVKVEKSPKEETVRILESSLAISRQSFHTNPLDARLLEMKNLIPVGINDRPHEGALFGATRYTTSNGSQFWQLKDGRIVHENSKLGESSFAVWTPYGSGESSGHLARPKSDTSTPFKILTLDERHNVNRSDSGDFQTGSTPVLRQIDPATSHKEVPFEKINQLQFRTANFEHERQSTRRILPEGDGASFRQSVLSVDLRKGKIPSAEEIKAGVEEHFDKVNLPARMYRIMSQSQMHAHDDLHHQFAQGKISRTELDAGVAEIRSNTHRVVVEESYAEKLDALRNVRSFATLSPQTFPELGTAINQSRRELFTSPLRDRMLPEHLGQFLDSLPNPHLTRNIILFEHSSTLYKRGNNESLADALSAQPESRIRIFGDAFDISKDFRLTMTHEWSHILQGKANSLVKAVEIAEKFESFAPREYARKNNSENWAVNLGEMFLHPNPELFTTLAREAPIKTVLLAAAVERTIKENPTTDPFANRAYIHERLNFVRDHVHAEARAKLTSALESAKIDNVLAAVELVRHMRAEGADKAIIESLLEMPKLNATADFRPDNGVLGREVVNRLLLRLDLIKDLDPVAFKGRRTEYDSLTELARTYHTSFLTDGDAATKTSILNYGSKLLDTNLQGLFKDVFPIKALENAALNPTQVEAAKQAFSLLDKVYRAESKGFESLMRIIENAGPNKTDAVLALMGEGIPFFANKYTNLLAKEFNAGKFDADASKTIIDALRAKLQQNVENPPAELRRSIANLMRAALLEHLVTKHPEQVESSTLALIVQQRNELQTRVRTALTLETENTQMVDKLLRDIGYLHAFDLPGMKDYSKALMDFELAKAVIQRNEPYSEQALSLLSDLHYGASRPFFAELAATKGAPLRFEALSDLLYSTQPKWMAEANRVIQDFGTWGSVAQRVKLLDTLSHLINQAAEAKVLDESYVNRTALRIESARSLMSPLSFQFHSDLINRIDKAIEQYDARIQSKK